MKATLWLDFQYDKLAEAQERLEFYLEHWDGELNDAVRLSGITECRKDIDDARQEIAFYEAMGFVRMRPVDQELEVWCY